MSMLLSDDPLQAALAEAESLMESLGVDNNTSISDNNNVMTMDGFAIDSDDEEDDNNNNNNGNNNSPTRATTNMSKNVMSNPSGGGGGQTTGGGLNLHPLSDTFLTTNNNNNNNQSMQHPLNQQQQQPYSVVTTPAPLSSSSGPSIDLLKASTTRFASNFANMAQRATATVVGAATGSSNVEQGSYQQHHQQQQSSSPYSTTFPVSMNTSTSNMSGGSISGVGGMFATFQNPLMNSIVGGVGGGGGGATMNQQQGGEFQQAPQQLQQHPTYPMQQQQQQYPTYPMQAYAQQQQQQQQQYMNYQALQPHQQQQPRVAVGTSPLPQQQYPVSKVSTSLSASSSLQTTKVSSMVQPVPVVEPPPKVVVVELDKEQKAALIREHVGTLLPGEHVIMFVANILQVTDSVNLIASNTSTTSTNSSTMDHSTSNNNNNNNPLGWCCAMTYYRLLFFNTSTSSSSSSEGMDSDVTNGSNSTYLECPSYWNKACWPMKPIEKVIQIPLACIERIERSTFTTPITVVSSSGTMIPSSLSNTLSGSSNIMMNSSSMTSNNNSNPYSLSSSTGNNNNNNTTTTMITSTLGLLIHSKISGRHVRVIVSTNYQDTVRFHETVANYAFPGRRNLGYLFAFECKRDKVMQSIVHDPLNPNKKSVTLPPYLKRFEPITEYTRQFNRNNNNNHTNSSNSHNQFVPWSIWTDINHSYQTCQSYPNIIVGPATLYNGSPPTNDNNNNTSLSTPMSSMNEATANASAIRLIRQCAAFRSEQRLPSLSWCEGSSNGGGSLWRASQPKIGLQGNRSNADELYMKHILDCSIRANHQYQQQGSSSGGGGSTTSTEPIQIPIVPRQVLVQLVGTNDLTNWVINDRTSCGLKIMDLRPRSSATANRATGYGYENTSNYYGTTLQFYNIGNIHAVRDSYNKVCTLCHSYNSSYDMNWNMAVEDTKWLSHLRLILAASWEAAYWVFIYKLPVLIHCSHGWDRTSQVVALAQILLDPYYRTMAGFACLIEKDFLSFGHPFQIRCGHGEGIGPGSNNNSSNDTNGGTNGSSTNTSAGSAVANVLSSANHPILSSIHQNLISNSPFGSSSNSSSGGGTPGGGGGSGGTNNNTQGTNNTNSGTNTASSSSSYDESQIAPIFLQFLDCVYQIVALYPEAFEYNTKYILLVSEHIYSCRFGNFLCDTERERENNAGIRQRTESIWDYLETRPDVYNKRYHDTNNNNNNHTGSGNGNHHDVLLMPLPTLLRNVHLWTDRHCRHSTKPTTQRFYDINSMTKDRDYYVTTAMMQQKQLVQHEQTPFMTQQEYQRMLYVGSSTTTTTTSPSVPTTNTAVPTTAPATSPKSSVTVSSPPRPPTGAAVATPEVDVTSNNIPASSSSSPTETTTPIMNGDTGVGKELPTTPIATEIQEDGNNNNNNNNNTTTPTKTKKSEELLSELLPPPPSSSESQPTNVIDPLL